MSDQTNKEIIKILKNIDEKLDILISIEKKSMPKQEVGQEEKKVLELCDRKHTVADIAKETNKTENNVNFIISRLKDKLLIRSVKVNGITVYERI